MDAGVSPPCLLLSQGVCFRSQQFHCSLLVPTVMVIMQVDLHSASQQCSVVWKCHSLEILKIWNNRNIFSFPWLGQVCLYFFLESRLCIIIFYHNFKAVIDFMLMKLNVDVGKLNLVFWPTWEKIISGNWSKCGIHLQTTKNDLHDLMEERPTGDKFHAGWAIVVMDHQG